MVKHAAMLDILNTELPTLETLLPLLVHLPTLDTVSLMLDS